jgi:molybdate transport system regulatory protein
MRRPADASRFPRSIVKRKVMAARRSLPQSLARLYIRRREGGGGNADGVKARLSVRIDLAEGRKVGPGKVRLLEQIALSGSISGAGRELGMSYKRAWDLVDELNHLFREPVVTTRTGGRDRGGASLTAFGRVLIEQYRTLEAKAQEASAHQLAMLEEALATKDVDEMVGRTETAADPRGGRRSKER